MSDVEIASQTLDQATATIKAKHNISVVSEKITYSDEKEERLAMFVDTMYEKRRGTLEKETPVTQSMTTGVEEHIYYAENEILFKRERTFFMMQYEREKGELAMRQVDESRLLYTLHKDVRRDVISRRRSKAFRIKQLHERKLKDLKIHNQQLASRAGSTGRQQLAEKYESLDKYVGHTQQKQKKRMTRLELTQKRRINDKQMLIEFEIKELNLSGDAKAELMHNFQFQLNHSKAMDKREAEHMREIHNMEITLIKALGDVEIRMIDQLSDLHIKNLDQSRELEESSRVSLIHEKECIKRAKDAINDIDISVKQDLEDRQMQNEHELQTAASSRFHAIKENKRVEKWQEVLKRQFEVLPVKEVPHPTVFQANETLTGKLQEARNELQSLVNNLQEVSKKGSEKIEHLRKEQNECYKRLEETFLFRIMDLETKQEVDFAEIWTKQRGELAMLVTNQQRELEMESLVRAAETKALFERKVLSSILDTISDGVITITPAGMINRFNVAASKMFDYPVSYAMGKSVKLLMDNKTSSNHDNYIHNYLETNTKKIIGKGRQAEGQKRTGERFPIYLSVSEVKGDGYHIFTGIINDLTEELRVKNAIKAEEDRKKQETQMLLDSLAVYQNRSTKLLEQMLPGDFAHRIMHGETPPPLAYDNCTIFFSDIVGFTSIAGAASAMDVVNLLNDLYTYFDAVIDKHDCYKVETIGDAYNVVSGVPTKNGDEHAGQIVDMALHLLHGIYEKIIVRHTGKKLQIRIGCHTGACVAGVVGVKMPRYCLFGNTVNFASQMESGGSPMRIQISDTTYQILRKTGNYICQERDHPTEFGKGWIKTYWVFGKEGFDLSLPNPDEWPVIAHKKG